MDSMLLKHSRNTWTLLIYTGKGFGWVVLFCFFHVILLIKLGTSQLMDAQLLRKHDQWKTKQQEEVITKSTTFKTKKPHFLPFFFPPRLMDLTHRYLSYTPFPHRDKEVTTKKSLLSTGWNFYYCSSLFSLFYKCPHNARVESFWKNLKWHTHTYTKEVLIQFNIPAWVLSYLPVSVSQNLHLYNDWCFFLDTKLYTKYIITSLCNLTTLRRENDAISGSCVETRSWHKLRGSQMHEPSWMLVCLKQLFYPRQNASFCVVILPEEGREGGKITAV